MPTNKLQFTARYTQGNVDDYAFITVKFYENDDAEMEWGGIELTNDEMVQWVELGGNDKAGWTCKLD
jgi:hypothetical protein